MGNQEEKKKKQTNHVDQYGIVVLRLIIPGKRIKKIASEKMIFRSFFTIIELRNDAAKKNGRKGNDILCNCAHTVQEGLIYTISICATKLKVLSKRKKQTNTDRYNGIYFLSS